jgi:hypothetical protein
MPEAPACCGRASTERFVDDCPPVRSSSSEIQAAVPVLHPAIGGSGGTGRGPFFADPVIR